MESGALWSLATILGPIILGGIIAYALLTRRRLAPREKQAQAQATEKNYRPGDK